MILILFILFDFEHCFCFVVFYSTNKNLLTWASTTVSCSAALTFRSICLSCFSFCSFISFHYSLSDSCATHSLLLFHFVLSISFGCLPDCLLQANPFIHFTFCSRKRICMHIYRWVFNLCAWVSIWFYKNVWCTGCSSVCVPCTDFYYWKLSKQRI